MPEAKEPPQLIKTAELVKTAKANHADAFGKTNDKRGLAIANALFAELKNLIAEAGPGSINVRGLGKFAISEKTVTKDGEEKTRRRVVFRAGKK